MESAPIETAENPQLIQNKPLMCGGCTQSRGVNSEDTALFEEFRDIIEQKVQAQFGVPKDFKLEPTKVRTQVVAGINYYFHVPLPNGQFAHVRVFRPLQGNQLQNSDPSSLVHVDELAKED